MALQSKVLSHALLHSSRIRYCLKFPFKDDPSPVQPSFPTPCVDHGDMVSVISVKKFDLVYIYIHIDNRYVYIHI